MVALDLLSRRWTLRVLWELHQQAPLGFRELQRRCDNMSSSVLANRLEDLTDAGLLAADADGYRFTDIGTRLMTALRPLSDWANEWSALD
jgi:DNA-binding HxlR family transcriptional regulator